MEKGRTGLTFCAEFPNDTQARKFAEELVNRFSEIRKLRGGSLVFVDEQGNTLCEVAVLREHKLKKRAPGLGRALLLKRTPFHDISLRSVSGEASGRNRSLSAASLSRNGSRHFFRQNW
jgi:hypothetical protein